MANRFPLVLDVDSGNKIKELPSGDNLNLRESSIVNVQDVDALGTINAADITVNGERLVAQQFADLTDTPASYSGSENQFLKVNSAGDGVEFRPLSDLGTIEIDSISVNHNITPSSDNVVWIGDEENKVQRVTAYTFKGSLTAFDDTVVFDAVTGKISYAALQGAPTNLSEFTDDVGFLRTVDLDDSLLNLFDEGVPFTTDLQGSVFADDSTMIVDGVEGVIRGDTEYVDTGFIRGETIVILANNTVQLGKTELTDALTPQAGSSEYITVGTEDVPFANGHFEELNVASFLPETIGQGQGTGVGEISSSTDISITAGNRVKIDGAVPFRVSPVTTAERSIIIPQSGDIIYNSSTGFVELYQDSEWISLHQGTFTGNVTTATGESNFNDVVVAGDLTVQGTTTSIETTNTTITDNVIVLNEGEVGAGITATTAGIEIDRGSESNVTFVYDDSVDKWTLGSETLVAATFEGDLVGDVTATDIEIDGATGRLTFDSLTAPEIRNSNGSVRVVLFGEDYSPGTAQVYVEANDVWLYSDLLVEQDAEVKGKLKAAAIEGTFVGDDSTILVDGVAGKVVGDVDNAEVVTTTVQGRDNVALNIYRGTDGTVSLGDASSGSVSVSNSGISIASTGGVNINGAAGAAVDIGTGGSAGDVNIGKSGQNVIFTNGTTVDFSVATLTFPASITTNLSGNVTGNIDNTALTVGGTTATSITIGNSGSTTTIEGTIEFTDALIANNLTADDSITIRTDGNSSGEAINLIPQGSNNAINLVSENIRFNGPVTNEVSFTGGIIGDVKGTITGDDSTILVDAVNSLIPYSVLDGAPTNLSDLNNDLDYAGIVGTTIQNNGLPVDTFMTGDLDAQNNDIENANLVNATGNFQGDVVGSVFADDSAVMVNAVDFAMFSDTITLTPLNAEPANVINGMVAIADGTSWNPLATGVQTMMVYLGGAWRQIATA